MPVRLLQKLQRHGMRIVRVNLPERVRLKHAFSVRSPEQDVRIQVPFVAVVGDMTQEVLSPSAIAHEVTDYSHHLARSGRHPIDPPLLLLYDVAVIAAEQFIASV